MQTSIGKLTARITSCPLKSRCERSASRQRMVSTRALAEVSPLMSTEFLSADEDALGDWAFNEDGIMVHRPLNVARVQAPPNARPILILPGFGNNTSDYEAPFGRAEDSLATHLRARGFHVRVVPMERKDWVGVARAIFTFRFWNSTLTTHPGYTWYLDRVHSTLEQLRQETGADKVDFVCHSAGGWLGRAFLGDPKYTEGYKTGDQPPLAAPNPAVGALVTLGTPQRPPPPELSRDMTGGAQGWVHRTYPGAFFRDQGVHYVCVGGVTVRGRREVGADGKPVQIKGRNRLPAEYAHDSYWQVCGQGQGIEGDAVVPLGSAFLAGARHVLLPGVWHSVSRIGTFEEESGVVWYGSERVIDGWLGPYVDEAYGQASN